MLNKISLKLFKCFKEINLSLAPLTLLSGQNSSGKSTVIQALVLLHQTMRWQEWSNRLLLNGRAIQLGTVFDVVDSINGRDSFEISISDSENGSFSWKFCGNREEMSMELTEFSHNGKIYNDEALTNFYCLLPFSFFPNVDISNIVRRLTYLTAERIGPRQLYAFIDRDRQYNDVGTSGEYAASVLYQSLNDNILKALEIDSSIPCTVLKQVGAWLEVFFPHSNLKITPIREVNSIMLGFRNSNDTDFHRPINVGFGISQVFPIIVAVLTARKGDIVIVENPEVHLHPGGQALMGDFLARAVRAGIQIIVETHSDHVLNGVRKSVKNGIVRSDNVAIHFFRSRFDNDSQVVSLKVNSDGTLDQWPKDFFDQFDKDMNFFAGWGD